MSETNKHDKSEMSKEKGELIKKALLIVDKLAESDLLEVDAEFTQDDFDYLFIIKLITEAKRLKRSHHWQLR